MRWLKGVIPTLLVIAAAAVILFTMFSNHDADYGRVPLSGGTVELPKGTVKVFYEETAQTPDPKLTAPVSIQVVPAGGGPPLAVDATAKTGTSETQVQRSEDISSLGSIAKLDVPAAGSYVVSGSGTPGASLTFGTDPVTAVIRRWEILAILLGAALLISLAPLSSGRAREDETSGWSSDSRAPYAG